MGNLWRLGRTPSQAEFEQFFSNIAQAGSQQNLAAAAQAAATANQGAEAGAEATPGIPRVASIDLLRKMMMNHQPGMVAPVAPSPTMMPGMFPGATGMPNTGTSARPPHSKRASRDAPDPTSRPTRNRRASGYVFSPPRRCALRLRDVSLVRALGLDPARPTRPRSTHTR